MFVELHPAADNEFAESALYYERQVAGLGYRFVEVIERSIGLLEAEPRLGTPLDEQFRYFVLDEFPFSLIYAIETDRIWIVAVSHQKRHPEYWRYRSGG